MILIFLLLLATSSFLSAQTYPEMLDEIRTLNRMADRNEDYLKTLIGKALEQHPDKSDLYMELADFYNQKRDYDLELANYKKAESLDYENKSYLYMRMAEVYSLLDQNDLALIYGQKIVELSPKDETALANLLWYYLKNFKLEEGKKAGDQALLVFPNSLMINSMQALILMGLYHYNEAQGFFEKAVDLALRQGQHQLAAMNLYNQFLLERNFYAYKEAERTLNRALSLAKSSSNYRLLGELRANQLNYTESLKALKKSIELEALEAGSTQKDRTPLGHLALAELALRFAKPNEAKQALDEAAKLKNVGWMTNFGLNQELYLSNFYGLYKQLWQQKARQTNTTLTHTLPESLALQNRQNVAHFYSLYYGNLETYYRLKAGEQLGKAGNMLSSYQYYIGATQGYRGQLTFTTYAHQLEQAFTHKADPHYNALKAFINKDKTALKQALLQFDEVYEKSDKQEALLNLIELSSGKEKKRVVEELYQLNPAMSKLYALPIQLKIEGPLGHSKLPSYLKKAFKTYKEALFTLQIEQTERVRVQFYEGKRLVFSRYFNYNRGEELELAQTIIEKIYSDREKIE